MFFPTLCTVSQDWMLVSNLLGGDLTLPLEFKHLQIESANRFSKELSDFVKMEQNIKSFYLVKLLRKLQKAFLKTLETH